jgi:hypothetical protein
MARTAAWRVRRRRQAGNMEAWSLGRASQMKQCQAGAAGLKRAKGAGLTGAGMSGAVGSGLRR